MARMLRGLSRAKVNDCIKLLTHRSEDGELDVSKLDLRRLVEAEAKGGEIVKIKLVDPVDILRVYADRPSLAAADQAADTFFEALDRSAESLKES